MNAACIAIRLNPRAYIGYDEEKGACFNVVDPVQSAIKEAQEKITSVYWRSKAWSKATGTVLSQKNSLTAFGKGLYGKMLEAEKFRRYALKKKLRVLEDLYE